MMRDISDKQSLMELIDELQDLVDDKRERVAKLFADIRESVPRPMTLVFEKRSSGVRECFVQGISYRYMQSAGEWYGYRGLRHIATNGTEPEAIAAMQSHFDAAWSAMTAKGAAT